MAGANNCLPPYGIPAVPEVNGSDKRNFQNRVKLALRFSFWITLLLMMKQGAKLGEPFAGTGIRQ